LDARQNDLDSRLTKAFAAIKPVLMGRLASSFETADSTPPTASWTLLSSFGWATISFGRPSPTSIQSAIRSTRSSKATRFG